MTTIVTLTDDTYSANGSDGRKRVYASISCVNPYTATGEVITNSWFPNKFDGGKVTAVNPSCTVDLAGIGNSGLFRTTAASTSTLTLQFLNTGLPFTAAVGRWVDNTVANLSTLTLQVEMIGR